MKEIEGNYKFKKRRSAVKSFTLLGFLEWTVENTDGLQNSPQDLAVPLTDKNPKGVNAYVHLKICSRISFITKHLKLQNPVRIEVMFPSEAFVQGVQCREKVRAT